MRGWGVTALVTAAGCVFLPWPLNLILAAVVMAAGILAGSQAWADYQRDLETKSKAETADHQAWLGDMNQIAEDDAAWERLREAVNGRPESLIFPGKLRSVRRIPQQRTAAD